VQLYQRRCLALGYLTSRCEPWKWWPKRHQGIHRPLWMSHYWLPVNGVVNEALYSPVNRKTEWEAGSLQLGSWSCGVECRWGMCDRILPILGSIILRLSKREAELMCWEHLLLQPMTNQRISRSGCCSSNLVWQAFPEWLNTIHCNTKIHVLGVCPSFRN